jgi:hypothetical protein
MPTYTFKDSDPRKPFEEPGEYLCTIEDLEFKYAQGSGNEMMVLKLRTSGGAMIYDNLVFIEAASWKIDHALKCFLPSKGKKPPDKDEEFELDTDYANENLRGATGWVLLSKVSNPQTGKIRNNVEAYLPPKKGGQPAQGTTTKPGPTTPPTSATTTKTAKPKPEIDDDEIPF